MTKIEVKQDTSSYHLKNEDGTFLCDHKDIEVVKACCSQVGSSGYIECGCGGVDSVVCDNPNCTGLTDEDMPDFNNDCWG